MGMMSAQLLSTRLLKVLSGLIKDWKEMLWDSSNSHAASSENQRLCAALQVMEDPEPRLGSRFSRTLSLCMCPGGCFPAGLGRAALDGLLFSSQCSERQMAPMG